MPGAQPADGSVMLIEREIGQIPYYPNQERPLSIKVQPNLVKKIMLHVRGFAQCATGQTAQINGRLGVYPFIRDVQLRASNGVVIKSIEPAALNLLNILEHGANEHIVAPAGGFTDAAAKCWSFDLSIPFDSITSMIEERTILNPNEYSELTLYLRWGNEDDFAVGALTNTSITLTDVVCDVVALERVPLDMNDELLNRQRLTDTMQIKSVADTGQIVTFDLPDNALLKTLLFYVEHKKVYSPAPDPTAPHPIFRYPLSEGVVRARVEDNAGAHIIRELSGKQIQSMNNAFYGMADLAPREWCGGVGGDINEVGDLFGNQKPGVYCIEFDKLHDFTSLYSTIDINFPRLVLTLGTIPGAVADYTQSFRAVLLQRQIITPSIATP